MTEEKSIAQLTNELEVLRVKLAHEQSKPRMSSEDRLYAVFWVCAAFVFATIAVTAGYTRVDSHRTFIEASKTNDPMRVSCALDTAVDTKVCTLLATQPIKDQK